MRAVIVGCGAMLVLTSCGSTQPSASERTDAAPATSASVASTSSSPSSLPSATAPPVSLTLPPGAVTMPIELLPPVTSSCPAAPEPEAVTPTSFDMADVAEVEANLGVARQYGEQHADEYAGIRAAWAGGHRVQIAFTDHLDEHRAALAAIVPNPEVVEVVPATHDERELNTIAAAALADVAPVHGGGGVGWLAADITLRPGQEDVADQLVAKYGDGVRIHLGSQVYVPAGCGEAPVPARCPEIVGADPATAGLELTVVADTPSITPDGFGEAHLVVHNVGESTFFLDSGEPLVGVLVTPGTNIVVGRYSGAIAGVGGGPSLEPGERASIHVVFGAERCDGQPGSALPPGTYGLRVLYGPEGGGGTSYLSPETLVDVTA